MSAELSNQVLGVFGLYATNSFEAKPLITAALLFEFVGFDTLIVYFPALFISDVSISGSLLRL